MTVTGGKWLHFIADLDTRPLAVGAAKSKGIVAGMGKSFKKIAPFSPLSLGAAGVGIAAAAMFTKVSKAAYTFSKDFEKAMLEVKTISVSVQEDFENISDEIINLSAITPEGAIELTKGLYQIVSAGYDGAEAMNILTVSTQTATAALTDTFTVADVLTTIMNSYGTSAGNATSISDRLFTVVKNGKITMGELAKDLSTVAGLAAQAGVDLDDLFAAYSTGTKTLQSDIFTTGIRGLLTAIIQGPTDDAKAVIKELGIQFDITSLQTKGLVVFLQDLIKATNGDIEVISALIPNVRGLTGLLSLATDEGKEFEKQLDNIKVATGSMTTAYKTMLDAADNQWSIVHNKWRRELKELGDAIKIGSVNIAKTLNRLLTDRDIDIIKPEITKNISNFSAELDKLSDRESKLQLIVDKLIEVRTQSKLLGEERTKLQSAQPGVAQSAWEGFKITTLGAFGFDQQKLAPGGVNIDLLSLVEEDIFINKQTQKELNKLYIEALNQPDIITPKVDPDKTAVRIKNIKEFLNDIQKLKEELGTGTIEHDVKIRLQIEDIETTIDEFDKAVQEQLDQSWRERTNEYVLEQGLMVSKKATTVTQTKKQKEKTDDAAAKDIAKLLSLKKVVTKEEREQVRLLSKKYDLERKIGFEIDKTADGLYKANELLGAMSYAASQFDEELGKSLGTMADIANNAANLITSLGSQNYISAAASAIGIIGNMASLFGEDSAESGIDKMNASLEKQNRILERMNTIEWLQNVGTVATNINRDIDSITQSLNKIILIKPGDTYGEINQLDTDTFGIKEWMDFLDEYRMGLSEYDIYSQSDKNKKELEDLGDKLYSLNDQLNQLEHERQLKITGIDVTEISESILGGIEEGFSLGATTFGKISDGFGKDSFGNAIQFDTYGLKTDLADFAKTFGELMEKSLRNHIKTALEDKVLIKFMENFTEAMAEDGLSDSELENLKNDYAEGIRQAQEMWESLMPVLDEMGITTEDEQAGLTGAIRGITEETAGLIAGQFTAMRADLSGMVGGFAEQADFFDEFLEVQREIATNTGELNRLEMIEKQITEMNATVEARL